MRKTFVIDSCSIDVNIGENSFTIFDSYKIVDDGLKEKFIENIMFEFPAISYKRTKQSIFNEWKVHNAFFNRGGSVERTKDTDFELTQSWIHKLLYSVVSKLLKEQKGQQL